MSDLADSPKKVETYRNLAAQHSAQEPKHVSVLPPELANQIAAGEVVERPASVVKELVENSLDAGAKRVEVTIENGGRDLIRVEDDGCGMFREDALRALERHATSKISCVEDLFSIGTLGFRGEAVPSIGSVSVMELKTKPHGEIEGTRIQVSGGHLDVVEDVGMAAGTSIQVSQLFYNTPARLKFLKTPATESRYITQMIVRMALSRPDVRFRLRRDNKTVLDLPEVEGLKERILAVMGRDVYDNLFPTYEFPAVNGVVARGYYSKPSFKQRTPGNIYTFVNGRFIQDNTVRAAIKGAYGTLMESGRYPSVILFLEVPYDLVDINAHPAKIEVRFHDTNSIYRAVYHAIADALADAPWVKREARTYQLNRMGTSSYEPAASTPSSGGSDHARPTQRYSSPAPVLQVQTGESLRQQDFSTRLTPNRVDFREQGGQGSLNPVAERAPVQQGFKASSGMSPLLEPAQSRDSSDSVDAVDNIEIAEESSGYFSSLRVIGQFKRQYIVCEDATSLVVIDQHAAHERIGFERLKKIFQTDHKENQPLLFPKRLELDAIKAATLGENLDFFDRAGFEIEHFGGQTYVLKSVPAIFAKGNIDRLVLDAVEDLAHHGRTDRMDEAMEAILSRMACHSVVRGPTSLTNDECYALFKQMDEIDFAANCPHGRPVYFRMSLDEIEISFERK